MDKEFLIYLKDNLMLYDVLWEAISTNKPLINNQEFNKIFENDEITNYFFNESNLINKQDFFRKLTQIISNSISS